jgi:hypothetical protein
VAVSENVIFALSDTGEHTHIHTHTHTHIHTHIHTYTNTHILIHTYTHTHIHTYNNAHTHTHRGGVHLGRKQLLVARDTGRSVLYAICRMSYVVCLLMPFSYAICHIQYVSFNVILLYNMCLLMSFNVFYSPTLCTKPSGGGTPQVLILSFNHILLLY